MTNVKCANCQHVQAEPVGLDEFACNKCGHKLKRLGAKTAASSQTGRMTAPAPGNPANKGKKTGIAIGVLVLAAIGLFMSTFTTTTVMNGSGTIWIGVVVAGIGTAIAFFLGAANWVRVIAAICLALGLFSAFYIEHELTQKRTEISNIFKNGP